MNPAALKTNLPDLPRGGTLIVNTDEFNDANLRKAGYESNPLEDGALAGYRVIEVPITSMNARALKDSGLNTKQIDRSKNFFALGLMFWLYERPLEPTLRWIDEKFAKNPAVAKANVDTLKAGYNYGETAELFPVHYRVPKAHLAPGRYRNITGNEATALGFLTASRSGRPAALLRQLPDHARQRHPAGARALQELRRQDVPGGGRDRGHRLGDRRRVRRLVWASPARAAGLALKSEGLGLAVMVELPIVVAMIQRSGPSTGMPTKTEQADLLQAMFGRNGECPVAIVAPATPSECFDYAIEAFRIAITHMVPTIFLSDGYLGTGSEPWLLPALADLPQDRGQLRDRSETFKPYARDPRRSRGRGPSPARPASSTASAASRRPTSPAT